MAGSRMWIARQWRISKVMVALFIIEFPLTIAMLTLFGLADPNTYRTKLWQDGADNGFNSDPSVVLYSYANYKPIATPYPWNSFVTSYNVVASVLSMFILLTKVTIYVMHWFIPLVSVITHAALIAIYAVSIANQGAADMSDPKQPSPGLPWYLSKGCSYAKPQNYSYCMQARASYGVSIVLLALFSIYFIWSCYNLVPTAEEKFEREKDIEMEKVEMNNIDAMSKEEQREYNRALFMNLPKTPSTPFNMANNPMTPRTVAFTKLNGGEKPEAKVTVSKAGPSRQLPFREHYAAKD